MTPKVSQVRWGAAALTTLIGLATAGSALAQARGQVSPQNPGQIRDPGVSGVSGFNSYSYGIGSVGSRPSGGGDALRSPIESSVRSNLTTSITQQTNFPLRSGIAAPQAPAYGRPASAGGAYGTAPVTDGQQTGIRYRPMQFAPLPYIPTSRVGADTGGADTGGADGAGSPAAPATGTAQTYLQGLARQAGQQDQPPPPIRSLAPGEPGLLRDYILDGERSFRRGDYRAATRTFQVAHDLEPSSTEAVLALFHARVATATVSYDSAAYLLGRVLQMTPELPMAPIRPRTFYGRMGDYGDHLDKLNAYCRQYPDIPAGWFVLAYFRWFEDDLLGARQAIEQASANAGDQDPLRGGIDIFADGMRATGLLEAMSPAPEGPSPSAPQGDDGSVPADAPPDSP